MASNPPFQLEDQTDEDFFDKLVDDDFGPAESLSSGAPKFAEGNESDDARAFANLSIGEDSGGEDRLHEPNMENDSVDVGATGPLLGEHADEQSDSSLVGANASGLDSGNMAESNTEGLGPKETASVSESTAAASLSGGSLGSGVKEVGWSSFYADVSDNGEHNFGTYSDFFSDLGESSGAFPGQVEDNVNGRGEVVSAKEGNNLADNSFNYLHHQDGQMNGNPMDQTANYQDLNSSQYWDNLYPGWMYDHNTGQWYQVDGYDAKVSPQVSYENSATEWGGVSDEKSELSYMQQSSQSVLENVVETSTTKSVSHWNQANNGYPEHMIFDPQYPGWYYDTIAQEWRSLESYNAATQSTVQAHDLQNQDDYASRGTYLGENNSLSGQPDSRALEGLGNQAQHDGWTESYGNYDQQGLHMWQPETLTKTETANTTTLSNFGGNHHVGNFYGSNSSIINHVDQQRSFNSRGAVQSYDKAAKAHVEANGITGIQSFVPSVNFSQQFNPASVKQSEQMIFSNEFYGNQNQVNVAQQSFQSNHQFSYAPNVGRSSAGRPPHALLAFGFGGKLIVMKDNNSLQNSSFGSQAPVGNSISVLNLMEAVTVNTNASDVGGGTCEYFRSLCQQSFPGPLVGGNAGSKEVNKWIDERIANCESSDIDYKKREVMRLLFSLLKIACQHYGKLRSPFGSDSTLRVNHKFLFFMLNFLPVDDLLFRLL